MRSYLIEREITPTMTAEAQGNQDVLFDVTTIKDVFRTTQQSTRAPVVQLRSVIMVDNDDQTEDDVDLYFCRADVSPAAAGAAFAGLSDADSANVCGHHFIDGSAVTEDFTNNKISFDHGLDVTLFGTPTDPDLYVFGVITGTPTTTAAGRLFRFVFEVFEGE